MIFGPGDLANPGRRIGFAFPDFPRDFLLSPRPANASRSISAL
jgi:hypothetical protein